MLSKVRDVSCIVLAVVTTLAVGGVGYKTYDSLGKVDNVISKVNNVFLDGTLKQSAENISLIIDKLKKFASEDISSALNKLSKEERDYITAILKNGEATSDNLNEITTILKEKLKGGLFNIFKSPKDKT